MLFRNFAASFPKACKEYDNMDNKDNKKKKGGKHPATADGHKPNWREVYATVSNCRGFYVVRRTEEERRQRARSMAFEASLSASQDNAQMHGCTDVF